MKSFFLARVLPAFAAILFLGLVTSLATAQDLTVTGEDLDWEPGNPSPVMTFGIGNTGNTDDRLWAWQLALKIVPQAGATGTVEFNSASPPASDYVLEGNSQGLAPPFSGPNDTIDFIGDNETDLTGVPVPSSGAKLLSVDFVASPDALGTFNVDLIPGENDAAWLSSDFAARPYDNGGFGSGDQTIGSVTIVPEPATWLLLVIGMVALVGFRQRRSR